MSRATKWTEGSTYIQLYRNSINILVIVAMNTFSIYNEEIHNPTVILGIFGFSYNYVTSQKVAGSRPDEVNDFYQVT
jgi:hypothetical protein